MQKKMVITNIWPWNSVKGQRPQTTGTAPFMIANIHNYTDDFFKNFISAKIEITKIWSGNKVKGQSVQKTGCSKQYWTFFAQFYSAHCMCQNHIQHVRHNQ